MSLAGCLDFALTFVLMPNDVFGRNQLVTHVTGHLLVGSLMVPESIIANK